MQDDASIEQYGFRSWSAENLFVDRGLLTGNTGPHECLAFAQWIVDQFKEPRNRVSLLGFRSIGLTQNGAGATWDLLTGCDIGDTIAITETSARVVVVSTAEPFFIEGIHETVAPLNPDMPDITLTLDVSPQGYFPFDYPLAVSGSGN